ncbi:MAG: phosphate ABC transporter permease PstA [Silvanigrellales bacterium]|nr:phosphate ABC transporter permease PstA [Silvanigrellales bacterium]
MLSGMRANIRSRKVFDGLFGVVAILALLVSILALVGLFVNLALQGSERIRPEFFLSFPSRNPFEAGILSAWVGSLVVMFVTALVGIPLGIAAGLYLEEYAPKNTVTNFIEINIMNLAGVPSIVYGLMALGLFVYKFQFGQSVLSAGLTLALLTLPIVITATREAIRTIPNAMREAAYALGATRWEVTSHHVLPYSMGGILTGTVIALSRAIGETAPLITIGALTFIAFLPTPPVSTEAPYLSFQWIWDAFTVLPIQMFNWVSRPQEEFQKNAAAAGVILMFMTLAMNGVAIWLRARYRSRVKW